MITVYDKPTLAPTVVINAALKPLTTYAYIVVGNEWEPVSTVAAALCTFVFSDEPQADGRAYPAFERHELDYGPQFACFIPKASRDQ